LSESNPFIPLNKPRSWVIFICACLLGIALGLLGFIFTWLGFKVAAVFLIALFVLSWVISFISWLVFISGLISGRYINIQHKQWSEQVW
jgi:membrane protein implicated in regulation of membrane protease activity